MGETAEACDVSASEDADAGLERRRVNLQPAALGLGQTRAEPGLEVGPASRGHEEPVTRDYSARLQMQHHIGGLAFHRHASVADDDFDSVGLEVRQECGARLWFLEPKKPGPGLH